jgi:DNA-binding transcriptional ArsR family regulator
MITLRFGQEDLLRLRFGISPLWETRAAVVTLTYPDRHAYHLPWLRRARAARLDIRALVAVLPARGYTPDFLAPPPLGPIADFDEEIARVRATPPDVVTAELAEGLTDVADPAAVRELAADPVAARDLLADQLVVAWSALVAPFWPRLRDLLDADVVYRSRQFAEGGTERVLRELHPRVRWRDGTVEVTGKPRLHRELAGAGLVLIPSVFQWPDVRVLLDPPWQPTVVYPARGVGAVWDPPANRPPDALAALIGRTRAALLLAVGEPASTTVLARRLDLAPSTVSEHLTVLRDAGLVHAFRTGRQVRYERTPGGDLLVYGQSERV